MAGVAIEETGAGSSFEGVSTGQQQSRCQAGLALAELRSSEQVENGSPSTSPPYWDSDDDNDDGGLKPADLYGKYTWKIDKFSQINKRELRSNAFEVGGYKWYILIYPQGCDVCNHLSLFLCVANHDKLLPGWSHFAQFTIAVVNKDAKKSKYSDTLHRFWKKEHDWGWKKFMELSKVMDGFIDADTLIIKAQVQVIRERPDRPFRCLDCQYRRELVRVYLTNVEQICRRFVEERREKLGKLLEDKARWSSFCAFWLGMDQSSRRRMSREKTESILKVVVKHFFIEKEVTSTLVMDSLYSGLKALEGHNKGKKNRGKLLEAEELPAPIVGVEKDTFILVDDVLLLLERAAIEPLPPKDEKGPQNRTKDGTAGEEFNRDSIERDERRLTELGRRTIEIFVLAHIFSRIEVAYQEAVALKKQEELIREEEAAWLAETEQKARRGVDKEKKSKKKQGKQKKNNRKAKDKAKDDKASSTAERKEIALEPEAVLEKPETVEDASDASDSVDLVPETLVPDSDDRDTDTSEAHPPMVASGSAVSGLLGVQNGTVGRSQSAVDDTSSTCSSDSVPSVRSVPQKGNTGYDKNKKSPIRGRNHQSKITSGAHDWNNDEPRQPTEAVQDATSTNDAPRIYNVVELQPAALSLQEKVRNANEKQAAKKDEETGSLHKSLKPKHVGEVQPRASSPPKSHSNGKLLVAPMKKPSANSPKQAGNSVVPTTSSENASTLKPVPQRPATSRPSDKPTGYQKHVAIEKAATPEVNEPALQRLPTSKPSGNQNQKPVEKPQVAITSEKPSVPPLPVISRPFTAPLVAGPRPAVSMVSTVQAAPLLARSVSAAGRLGPETTAYGNQSYVPQSYRNAMMGGGPVAGSSSTYSQNHSGNSAVVNPTHSYSQTSAPMFSPHTSERMENPNPIMPSLSFGMVCHHDNMLQNGATLWNDRPQRDCGRNNTSLSNELQSLDLNTSIPSRSIEQHHLPSEYPACISGRQSHDLLDGFPHLNIINELLDEEHGHGVAATANYQMFTQSHHINRQYTFPGDPAGPSGSACRFERTRSYHEDGFQHGYATQRDNMAPQASPRQYMNGQGDGNFVPSQWQMGGSDPSLLRNMESDGGYPYPLTEYPNPNLGVGINGYAMFRPSNGL